MSSDYTAKTIGTHRLTFEDDVLFFVQEGDYTLSDALQMNAEIEAVLVRLGRAFILFDQTRAGRTPPEARRCIAEWGKRYQASGAAVFGGSATVRALAVLVTAAMRLFNPSGSETVFFANEEQARAWIAAKRAKLLGS